MARNLIPIYIYLIFCKSFILLHFIANGQTALVRPSVANYHKTHSPHILATWPCLMN